jgi:hypothetical protein
MTRGLWRASAGVLLLVATFLVTAERPASADPVTGIDCVLGTFDVQLNPGAQLLSPQDIRADVQHVYTNCFSLSRLDISSGTADYSLMLEDFTCLSLAAPLFDVDYTIRWNTGETSRVVVDQVVIGATVVVTGQVESGVFDDSLYELTLQSFTLDLVRCLSPGGLTSITGVAAQLDIT